MQGAVRMAARWEPAWSLSRREGLGPFQLGPRGASAGAVPWGRRCGGGYSPAVLGCRALSGRAWLTERSWAEQPSPSGPWDRDLAGIPQILTSPSCICVTLSLAQVVSVSERETRG